MIDRCCDCARQLADALRVEPGIQILNEVVLNQVLLRFRSASGMNITPAVIARIQQDRVCWAGGTLDERTRTEDFDFRMEDVGPDVERSAQSMLTAYRETR